MNESWMISKKISFLWNFFTFLFFRNPDKLSLVENNKSHGSISVRYGALLFGIGTFSYFLIELLVFFEHEMESPCRYSSVGANHFLIVIFVLLQTYIIFMYPRLNFQCHQYLNRYLDISPKIHYEPLTIIYYYLDLAQCMLWPQISFFGLELWLKNQWKKLKNMKLK